LWKIKMAISYYHRIREVVDKQKQLVKEYQRARELVRQDGNFTADEVSYMLRIYGGILEESIRNLDRLLLVATAFATQMSDAKRMEIINNAADRIEENLVDLRKFNMQNGMISLQRAKEKNEIEVTKKLYGLQ
jgi:flagellar biosynthesis/type III secretory pathway chaperone